MNVYQDELSLQLGAYRAAAAAAVIELPLSVKQLVTQVHHLQWEGKAVRADTHKHFQTRRRTRSLSVRSNLLLTPGV